MEGTKEAKRGKFLPDKERKWRARHHRRGKTGILGRGWGVDKGEDTAWSQGPAFLGVSLRQG